MDGSNEQVIAVNIDAAEHLALPKLAESRQEFEYSFGEVGC